MRKIFIACAMSVCLMLLAQSAWTQNNPPTISQLRKAGPPKGPVPRLPSGQPDLGDATWLVSRGANFREFDSLMLPSAKTIMAKRDVTQDPHNYCMPDVVPRTTPFPLRFFFNYTHKAPTHLVIAYEGNIHSFRQVFMDGRKHPPELDPSWYGHSIGSWEKDTLAIDTIGFNDTSWYDGRGTPHTEQLHTVERYTRLDLGRLEEKVTIDDPGAYSKPFVVSINYTTTIGDDILEYICQAGNEYGQGTLPEPQK